MLRQVISAVSATDQDLVVQALWSITEIKLPLHMQHRELRFPQAQGVRCI